MGGEDQGDAGYDQTEREPGEAEARYDEEKTEHLEGGPHTRTLTECDTSA